MNERCIVVGNNSDGKGYYAMWANESTVLSGDTAIDAITKLYQNYGDDNVMKCPRTNQRK